jgi:hypothetical protein
MSFPAKYMVLAVPVAAPDTPSNFAHNCIKVGHVYTGPPKQALMACMRHESLRCCLSKNTPRMIWHCNSFT